MKRFIREYAHLFLVPAFPVLFLYSSNVTEILENVVVLPILVIVIGVLAIFFFFSTLMRSREKGALMSSFAVILFFSYSPMLEFFKKTEFALGNIVFGPNKIILLVAVFIFLAVFFILGKATNLLQVNRFFNLFSIVLVCLTLANIFYYEISSKRLLLLLENSGRMSNLNEKVTPADTSLPDIYYLIFDRYGGEETLKSYEFDNSSFYSFLENKGFHISRSSKSNYPTTIQSLASSLNMEYLDFLSQKTNDGRSSDKVLLTPLLKRNKVVEFLKYRGYKYYHLGFWWEPTKNNPFADKNLSKWDTFGLDEFSTQLMESTMLIPAVKDLYPGKANRDNQKKISSTLDLFKDIPKMEGPKFVFAHIPLPHPPYVFEKDCSTLTITQVSVRKKVENYTNQLSCTNIKIEETINNILSKSSKPPIIILQSDEGPSPIKYPLSKAGFWEEASKETLNEKFPILSAHYLPGLKENPYYESISPVNNFRVIFNTYFGANFSKLPDKSFIFRNPDNFYSFIDVSEKLN